MALVRMKPPVGVSVGLGADDKLYYIDGQGFANVDSGSVTKLTDEGWVSAVPVAPEDPGNTFPVSASKTLTGGIENFTAGGVVLPLVRLTYSSALAMILPSSGSVAANGALTLTTAVPLSGGYSWGCYMRFPAGAVYAGSAAGMYYVVMSSNSLGTIYDNLYTSGNPSIPDTPTPIVAAGPGAYTQTTSPIDLLTQVIPANSMGRNGRLIHQPAFIYPNNANNKVLSTVFGSSNVYAKTRTTATQDTPLLDIRNRGVANRQFSQWANSGLPAAASTSGVLNISVDTTADVNLITRGQLAVATDYIIVEASSVDISPF